MQVQTRVAAGLRQQLKPSSLHFPPQAHEGLCSLTQQAPGQPSLLHSTSNSRVLVLFCHGTSHLCECCLPLHFSNANPQRLMQIEVLVQRLQRDVWGGHASWQPRSGSHCGTSYSSSFELESDHCNREVSAFLKDGVGTAIISLDPTFTFAGGCPHRCLLLL